jgi:hypothetical protein
MPRPLQQDIDGQLFGSSVIANDPSDHAGQARVLLVKNGFKVEPARVCQRGFIEGDLDGNLARTVH